MLSLLCKLSAVSSDVLAFPLKVGLAVFARQALPPMPTSKQKAALIICEGAVEDPPWAAVQHRGQQLLGKVRIRSDHKP